MNRGFSRFRLAVFTFSGQCAKKLYARIMHLRLNELKAGRPPYVVAAKNLRVDSPLERPAEES